MQLNKTERKLIEYLRQVTALRIEQGDKFDGSKFVENLLDGRNDVLTEIVLDHCNNVIDSLGE
jgi:hypothetical protein